MSQRHDIDTAPPAADSWELDTQAMLQGWESASVERYRKLVAMPDIWDKTALRAAEQPIAGHCDVAACRGILAMAERLHSVADTLVVIGTGGASLGAQTLCAFAPNARHVRFLDNCDAHSIATIFAQCVPQRTAWVAISKSGETVETLAATLAVMAHYEAASLPLNERMLVITSEGDNPLRMLATAQHWPILAHPPKLGGRYSAFSCVGLLPAAFAGLNITHIGQVTAEYWNSAIAQKDPAITEAAAWFAAGSHYPMHVVMAYSDRLRSYTQWYKQLWAESLGKEGAGPTPVTATGSIDQHSQLQLYLDGARDKLFTLILPSGEPEFIPLAACDIPGISYLGAHAMGEIMQASAEATCTTMRAKGLPMRVMRGRFTAETLCQLMVRTMLETLMVASFMGIDPYSQPAVEDGKRLARQKLGLGSYTY